MRLLFLTFFNLITILGITAQDYFINFLPEDTGLSIDSIKVKNLYLDTSITLLNNDMLRLQQITTLHHDANEPPLAGINIAPNPMTESSVIKFHAPVIGTVVISIFDSLGGRIAQTQNTVEVAEHYFCIRGLPSGKYNLQVSSETYTYTEPITSNNLTLSESISILYIGKRTTHFIPYENRMSSTEKYLPFNLGDLIQIIAFSGKRSTIVMFKPQEIWTTLTFPFFNCIDADGHAYPIVKIGEQWWMGENLKTTRFNDLSIIPVINDSIRWSRQNAPALSWYNNDYEAFGIYGGLYNWYVIDTNSNGNKNPCPLGWHIPDAHEWRILYNNLGGSEKAGGKMKDYGLDFWRRPNTDASNSSGFTALPAGNRFAGGSFGNLGQRAHFWSHNEYYAVYAWNNHLFFAPQDIFKNEYLKRYGFSIRCVKDQN